MRSAEPPSSDEGTSLTGTQELLQGMLSDAEEPGVLFGSYVLFERLGQGGFGIVFRARRLGTDQLVALKQMRGGAQASPEERKQFLAGADTAAALEHPGIVRVHERGESDGCPFFTMDLLSGSSLAKRLARPCSWGQAARWLHGVALAIDYAHSRGVLHGDLKPANILLGLDERAVVADFGSARRLGRQGQCVDSGEGVLSNYMAPEQGLGDARSLSSRSDIYSLGVTLYELLTGRVPYEGLPFADWLAELVSGAPVPPPHELDASVHRGLELVCLKCLEKAPDRRYASAALLAEDLELVLQGWQPRHARAERAVACLARWSRRHSARSALLGCLVLVAFVAGLGLFSVLQAEREQEAHALETNAFIANSQAGALLFQLRESAARIERCAQLADIGSALVKGVVDRDSTVTKQCSNGFRAVSLAASDGRLLSEWPTPTADIWGRRYDFRDYFLGARARGLEHRPEAYLAPAYRAESNGDLQFAFAAPVLNGAGEWLGNVVGGLAVDSALEPVRMVDSVQSGRIVALLGPRDVDRATWGRPSPNTLDFIVHPKLAQGREVALKDPTRSTLERAFGAAGPEQFSLRWVPPVLLSDYRDPLFDPTRSWLAAFAPVGHSGYVVVVQTSKDALLDARRLAQNLAWRAGLPLLLGLSALGYGMLVTLRRKRSLELAPRHSAQRRLTSSP